jgi:hypothetical protein
VPIAQSARSSVAVTVRVASAKRMVRRLCGEIDQVRGGVSAGGSRVDYPVKYGAPAEQAQRRAVASNAFARARGRVEPLAVSCPEGVPRLGVRREGSDLSHAPVLELEDQKLLYVNAAAVAAVAGGTRTDKDPSVGPGDVDRPQ